MGFNSIQGRPSWLPQEGGHLAFGVQAEVGPSSVELQSSGSLNVVSLGACESFVMVKTIFIIMLIHQCLLCCRWH